MVRRRIKAQIPFRTGGVTYENTLLGSVIKLMTRIRSKMRIASTTKDLELRQVWGSRIQLKPGRKKK